jgi:peptidoglycan hydrolase-like protein with peptidoglycan-binding domain
VLCPMTISQNGYKSRDASLVATYTVVRDVKLTLRKGDASVVLLDFARWFDKNIEPLKKGTCGGYNPRAIGGSKTDSNHASGTAEDLNWGDHVMGKRNTFSSADQKKIREHLKFYEGVIRWGGDYKSRADDMHFEINKGPKDLARIAKKCKAANAPKPTPSTTPPKPGTPKPPPHVVVDGKMGPATIRLWQQIMGTKADGKIDDKDSALVRAVQTRLRATADHRVSVDGKMGKQTIGALQRYVGAKVDQILGPDTIRQLQRRLNTGRF